MLNPILEENTAILQDTDFLTDIELDYVFAEIGKLKSSFSRDGYNNKKTIRDVYDPRYCGTQFITNPRSILRSIWDKKFWNTYFDSLYENKDYSIKHSTFVQEGNVLLSAYSNEDYYGHHVDVDMGSIVTCVLMLCKEPKAFEGGSLYIEDVEIPFKNNKLIVFPSCAPHAVGKVSLDSEKYFDQRFTLQYFISATSTKKQLIDESNNIE